MEQQPMKQMGESTLPVQRPPQVHSAPYEEPDKEQAGVVPDANAAPYGGAFQAAHDANVAKVDAMRQAQATRMFGLSVGLRRSSMPGYGFPATAPSALDPHVLGTPAIGFTVTGSYVYVDPNRDPEGASIFAWLRDGVAIAGATAKTYLIVAADGGKKLAFRVTPVSSVGPTTGAPATSPAGTIPAAV